MDAMTFKLQTKTKILKGCTSKRTGDHSARGYRKRSRDQNNSRHRLLRHAAYRPGDRRKLRQM